MGRDVLPGEHYCEKHQGNHAHYAEHNCVLCKLKKEVADDTIVVELKAELEKWRGPECIDVDCPDYDAGHPYHHSQRIVGFEHGCTKGSDDLAAANDKIEQLEKTLLLLGDRAVVDWDDKMVGAVDAIGIDAPPTYKEWARSLFERAARTDKAEARIAELELVKPDLMPQHLLNEARQDNLNLTAHRDGLYRVFHALAKDDRAYLATVDETVQADVDEIIADRIQSRRWINRAAPMVQRLRNIFNAQHAANPAIYKYDKSTEAICDELLAGKNIAHPLQLPDLQSDKNGLSYYMQLHPPGTICEKCKGPIGKRQRMFVWCRKCCSLDTTKSKISCRCGKCEDEPNDPEPFI